jgi:glycerophosphoryl diester phosphodiesterase
MSAAARLPELEVIGHRGAAAHAPENTLASLAEAARQGARWVEFDARLTLCGELVLIHDETLERTTNGHGRVAHTSVGTLARLDAGSWFDERFAGEPVPTLGEALNLCRGLGMNVQLELKADDGLERATARAVARVLSHHRVNELLLSSLQAGLLEELTRLVPEVPRALVLPAPRDDWAELADRAACVALHVNHDWLSSEQVAAELRASRPALALRAFTVNDPERVRELSRWGLNAVFSDAPGRLAGSCAGGGPSGSSSPAERQPPAA